MLGTYPPADDGDEWLDTATDLLSYRATFGVTDTVTALGDAPAGIAEPSRRAWRARLAKRLAGYH